MNIIKHIIVLAITLISALFSQCDNNATADYNNDNILDVLDMVVLVAEIMNEIQNVQTSDINLDGVVDVMDVIKLVLKILNPYPLSSEIISLDYSDHSIFLDWEPNTSPLFKEYQVLMSNDVDEPIVIDIINSSDIIEVQISGIVLYQGTWLWINVLWLIDSNRTYRELNDDMRHNELVHTIRESGFNKHSDEKDKRANKIAKNVQEQIDEIEQLVDETKQWGES